MQLSTLEYTSYFVKHPQSKLGGWQPWAPARLALEIPRYSPIRFVPQVQAPTLFISATEDALCPPDMIAKASRLCHHPGQCTLAIIKASKSHFSMYDPDAFKESTYGWMLPFLRNHTPVLPLPDAEFPSHGE